MSLNSFEPITGDFVSNYHTKRETITVNSTDFQIHSLKDRQQYFDYKQRAEAIGISPATWSLFGVVWPAAHVLASTVSQLVLEGKRILEIGCGIGLSSIVLHKMGANITASDYHPLANEFLKKNVLANNLPPLKYLSGNWEKDEIIGEFDLIIGSDILYEPMHPRIVSEFILRHSVVDTQVIVVDPNRSNRSAFTKCMKNLGFSHYFQKFLTEDSNNKPCKGRILHFQNHAAQYQ